MSETTYTIHLTDTTLTTHDATLAEQYTRTHKVTAVTQ